MDATEDVQTYTLSQASQMLGVSTAILRRLCNTGLIPGVKRDWRGYRMLSEEQVDNARVFLELRKLGFSKAELKKYSGLLRKGKAAAPDRKAMLETQKRQLWQELEDCQHGIDFLERQVELLDRELK